jgi:hypothetical protein
LARLFWQLIKRKHFELEKAQKVYEQCKSAGRRPSQKELACVLNDVAGALSEVFVAVNALDKCNSMQWLP